LNDSIQVDVVRGIGRHLPRKEAAEGWVKKINRPRRGKVWVVFFHLWTTDPSGRRAHQQKEKTLGPASMPIRQAREKLTQYIEEYTSQLTKRHNSGSLDISSQPFDHTRANSARHILARWLLSREVDREI
jgi:hypothetical protein